ncbi:hypothetical protein Ddye_008566 [Dipteronia dyeriana]|uniref:ribulose-phosphate 3-epimerase n=1 Tax=Dipteronia dyeriana TaxID=168575 RepID=A0AAD9X9X9_9ROSI|nr:hypothetical protein Ddye_008566 [Dipteronia dyeriana]
MSSASLCSSTTQINGFVANLRLQKTNLYQSSSLTFTRRKFQTIVNATSRVDKFSKSDVIVSPSILSANFAKLGEQVKAVELAGCDWIHVDVMDGRFVPNITIGPLVVDALRPVTDLPLDVHLMIVEPEQRVPDFIKAGADIVSVHCEQSSTIHLHRTIDQDSDSRRTIGSAKALSGLYFLKAESYVKKQLDPAACGAGCEIKSLGAKAGVVLNPGTPLSTIEYVLDVIDLVLIMSVNPGFGGQSFIESQVKKISDLRRLCVEKGVNPWIEVDGGVGPKNAYKDLISERMIGTAELRSGLYILDVDSSLNMQCLSTKQLASQNNSRTSLNRVMLWHYRLGHPNFLYLEKLFPNLFINKSSREFSCEICELSKHTHSSLSPRIYHIFEPFALIHSEI